MSEVKPAVEKFTLALDVPGHVELLLGNEAIARGIIEAGARVVTGYAGTPASEIVDSLARVAKEADIYVEWSTNEKVATEVATAASMVGLRAVTAMKMLGLNVALDFVMHLALTGSGKGGLVLVFADDPGALSSLNEQDSRWIMEAGDFPLLEPASPQEAKDMVKWAFELSEELRTIIFVRSVTRISHASGVVTMGEIQHFNQKASFEVTQKFSTSPCPQKHAEAKLKLEKARKIFESSLFNWYSGPKSPSLTIVCCGSGWLCAQDAIEELDVADSVGVIKLGTTWPLPIEFIQKHLQPGSDILMVEEVDPFIEINLKEQLYDILPRVKLPKVYGKRTGHISAVGEINPDIVIGGIAKIMGIEYQSRDAGYDKEAREYAKGMTDSRDLIWCPGCPERAALWEVKKALRLDGREGFVASDVGCYTLDRRAGGQQISATQYGMGSGSGLGSGFGNFGRFGYEQPIVATCGDSTFFHAAIPAIINAIHHQSNLTVVLLDNSTTAMTGFQPHPGLPVDAVGDPAIAIDIEKVCRAFGCRVEIADPYDMVDAQEKLWRLLGEKGTKVMIMRRECGLLDFRKNGPHYRVWVNQENCLGEECGCNRYCMHSFKCPALIWDMVAGKAKVDEVLCTGCGFCVNVCPQGAIQREER